MFIFCERINKEQFLNCVSEYFPEQHWSLDRKLFETKRKDQMHALKNMIELNDINQQYKIIDIMLKGLFKVSKEK